MNLKKIFRAAILTVSILSNISASAYTINGSANVINGGDFQAYSDNLSTRKWRVDGTTGDFGTVSGGKFYLDGTGLSGDTYIYEIAPNIVEFFTNGSLAIRLTTNEVNIGSLRDLTISPTKKFFLDDGSDTYLTEISANRIGIYTGGTEALDIQNTVVGISPGRDLTVESGKKIFVDGGVDTYINDASGMSFHTGASFKFKIDDVANNLYSAYPLSLPAVDPPVANEANSNSFVKAWAYWNGATAFNYNLSSFTHPSTGVYIATFDTDFSSANYGVVITPEGGDFRAVVNSKSTGAVTINIYDSAGSLANADFNLIAIGTQ